METKEKMESKKGFLGRISEKTPKPVKLVLAGAVIVVLTMVGGKLITGFMDGDLIPGPTDDLPIDEG